MLDDNDTLALAHGAHYLSLLVFTWTISNTASHLALLSVGLTHFGGAGTYTVIITN